MDEQSWRGHWWDPAHPEVAIPGTFYSGPEGRMRLELVGGFDTEIRTPLPGGNGFSVDGDSRDLPLIHGTSGAELFTLIGTHASHTSGSGFFGGGIVEQDLSPNRALRGVHLGSPSESRFVRAHLQLERLLHWSARSTFNLRLLLGESGRESTAATHPIEPLTASYNDVQIGLRVRSTMFNLSHRPVANRRSMETNEWATLDFDAPELVPFNFFDTLSKDMQDLLTLSSYAPCGSQARAVVFPVSERRAGSPDVKEVELLGRQIFQSDTKTAEKSHHDFLFTLEDIEFRELVPRWLKLKEAARLGFNILFGLRYISSGYVGTRLLGVATAAESIHRALCPTSTPLPKQVYRDLKRALLKAVEGETQAIHDFVNIGLRNDPTYNQRMLDLASIPDASTVDLLLTDRVEWASRLKAARHDLAHANERSENAASSEAFWLLEITYALLCLVAMSRLGFDADVQRRALGHPKIQWASRQFKKELTAPPSS